MAGNGAEKERETERKGIAWRGGRADTEPLPPAHCRVLRSDAGNAGRGEGRQRVPVYALWSISGIPYLGAASCEDMRVMPTGGPGGLQLDGK